MLKVYCTECGSPTNYTASKPKFCSSCGTSFDKLVVNKVLMQKPTADKPVAPKRIAPKIQKATDIENDDEYDDYDDPEDDINKINNVPSIRRLDVEIDQGPSVQQKTKIGDIIGSAKGGAKREKIKGKNLTKAERQKFLEDFKKEAGAIRPRSRGAKDG